MNKVDVIFFAGVLSGLGYIGYLMSGTDDPANHRYHQLFQKETFIKHLAFCILTTIAGVYFFQIATNDSFWFAPLLILLFIKIADYISLKVNKRHPLFWTKYDDPSTKKGNWLDYLLFFCICLMPFTLCVLIFEI